MKTVIFQHTLNFLQRYYLGVTKRTNNVSDCVRIPHLPIKTDTIKNLALLLRRKIMRVHANC